MHALEVTGNLSKEESRDGRSDNDRGLDLSPKEPWINGTSLVRPWFRGTGKKFHEIESDLHQYQQTRPVIV
jgi:hypothetical protein